MAGYLLSGGQILIYSLANRFHPDLRDFQRMDYWPFKLRSPSATCKDNVVKKPWTVGIRYSAEVHATLLAPVDQIQLFGRIEAAAGLILRVIGMMKLPERALEAWNGTFPRCRNISKGANVSGRGYVSN